MSNFNPPMLGLSEVKTTTITVAWKNGDAIGILGPLDAKWLADRAREHELRSQGVAILRDYRSD
jgi:hypothetical protein